MARDKFLIEVTQYRPAEEKLNTVYGLIAFKEWLDKEAERLGKDEIETKIVYNALGSIALVRTI